jgi:hypothetical protein
MTDDLISRAELTETKTGRGFTQVKFKDRYGVACSIQKSSLATEGAIWIGADDLGLKRFPGDCTGWHDVDLSEIFPGQDIVANTSMHLTQDQVRAILPVLSNFVETGDVALPAAQVQAEPVAQEPVAWRVYGMMRQGAPNNVKARGIGSDPTEYLYPVHREADARECARLMRGEVQPLYSHPATTSPAPDGLDALVQRLQKLGRDMDRHAAPDWDDHEDVFAAVNAITALRARPATVQVKPLAWLEEGKGRWIGKPDAPLGEIAFWIFAAGAIGFSRHTKEGPKHYHTLEAAKAAAQADYEARIRAALVASEPASPASPPEDTVDRATANRLIAGLQAENAELRAALDAANADAERLAEALIWASGSPDFNDGGQAEKGWRKVARPALAAHEARKRGA